MTIESLSNIEGLSGISDSGRTTFEISDSQLSYLKELDVTSENWENMSDSQKEMVISKINDRFEEMNISDKNVINDAVNASFSPEIANDFMSKFENTLSGQVEKTESIGLSDIEKRKLHEETGWSDKIIDVIKTPAEAEVYKQAGLKEMNGNLERLDIDWNAKIPQDRIDRMRSLYGDEVADRWSGKTNMDLIKEGKAPYGPDGEWINLHHIGQKTDSPLAELTNTEHKTYDSILHDKTKSSEIERPVFRTEKQAYWMNRYAELNNKNRYSNHQKKEVGCTYL